MRAPTRAAALAGALACALVCGSVAAGYLTADVLGVLVAVSALAVVVIVVAWLGHALGRRAPEPVPAGAEPDPVAPFVSYRKIEAALKWARTSQAHYNRVVRPVLVRLLASRLAERHGVDLDARPDLAREIVGTELWDHFDPALTGTGSESRPGVDERTLHRLIDRLEEI